MKEDNKVILHIKKSDMNAKNPYEFSKLESARFYFVPCKAEESSDELKFTFDISGMRPFCEARKKMKRWEKYGYLLQILDAALENPDYEFSLNPNNLFLDSQDRVRILKRDIAGVGEEAAKKMQMDIKAFAGYLLQSRYSYENLREGGLELLKKQKQTKYISEIESFDQAEEIFQKAYREEKEKDRKEFTRVKRRGYDRCKWIMGTAIAASLAMAFLLFYQTNWIIKPEQSALKAERAYLENDFMAVTDALEDIQAEKMEKHEKYLLAAVYIRGQSVDVFNMETKERLVSKLSYHGDESLLDYWIYLGRLDVDQALDTAMKMSDNQLILYAYLQKLDMVSSDTSLTGEMKAQQISELKGKIKTLAEELGIEYKEDQAETE